MEPTRDKATQPPPVVPEVLPLPPASAAGARSSPGTATDVGTGQPQPEITDQHLCSFLAPAQSPDELGRLGPYRVLRVLGSGGMGVVFQAEDPQLQRLVALKAMLPGLAATDSAKQRFLREARAAAALKHDHVVTIHQVGEDRGAPFLAMEFLEGEPLDERLKREGKLPPADVLRIGREMAEGLAAAHERGLIHRDVKPANVWLEGKKARVKILDFGLARTSSDETHLTRTGAIVGTPAYMAPEQAQGKTVEPRSDLFSLGCVLYRMATGETPFHGPDAISTLVAVVNEKPAPPVALNVELPAELSDFIMQLLAKDPKERPESAEMVADHLDRMARGEQLPRTPKAGAAAVADPKDLGHSDVVITYSMLDDQPLLSGRPGWISQLHQNLQVRVAQLSGKQVAVVKHSDSTLSSEVEAEVLKQIPNAKTVVSVLSPPFAHSDECQRVVESFWKSATESGQFEIDNHTRLLNVIKTPVAADELPPDLRALYTGLVPYEFFERDPQTGRLREFDEAFGSTALQRFHERVYDVAHDISQVLKYLGDAAHGSEKRTANPKTIFLAATTSDLEPQRDQLRRELIELGHTVIPKRPLPLVASELVAVVQGCLEQADVAIHFVGEHFGLVPEATELSVVALQNQVAARFCDNSSLKRLIWIPKGLQPRDDRQASFLRQLQADPHSVTGAELIADTLENLKVLLRTRWEREQAERDKPAQKPAAGSAPRVYLICDQQDEAALEPLEDFFYEQGIEVSLPGFEAEESEVQQIHVQNLRDCDAALIYYGAAGMHWVDFKMRDLQKAAGYREGRPIAVSAVFVAPPFNHRKDRFKSVSTEVIRQKEETFAPGLLADFVAAIRQAKDAEC